MHSTHLFVVRYRDNFVRKCVYVYRAFTSYEKLISYLKEEINHRDENKDILIVDVTCMKYNKELCCYEVMSIWEYNEKLDNWFWDYSGYLTELMFKLPIERSEKGYFGKWRNEE